ncbi:MAG: response regulator [Calditrichaeota bacterium]|nr:MAG: response regulator [Calditrichota bacterium]MBL1207695.1 response regulator [Calditrichota bacterium]NOG47530.1 response regulator [Calditrichota bacterium]
MSQLSDPLNYKDSLILIAEDNAITLQLLCRFLDKEGLKYITCNNGSAAINLANKKLPDLILLDVTMPQIDGFDTCRILKDNTATKNIPVIFLSSKSDSFNKLKGFSAGAIDFITKPFEKVEIMVRIKTQLKLKKALDKLSDYSNELEKTLNEETEKESFLSKHIHQN